MVRHRARTRQLDDANAPTAEDYARLCCRRDQGRGRATRPAAAKTAARAGQGALRSGRRRRRYASVRSSRASTRNGSTWTSRPTICPGPRRSTGTTTRSRWWGPRVPAPSWWIWSVRCAIPTKSARIAACPPLARGDCVAFLDAGGYTESCAARYNAQLLPASVLVCGAPCRDHHRARTAQGHRRPLPGAAAPAGRFVRAVGLTPGGRIRNGSRIARPSAPSSVAPARALAAPAPCRSPAKASMSRWSPAPNGRLAEAARRNPHRDRRQGADCVAADVTSDDEPRRDSPAPAPSPTY